MTLQTACTADSFQAPQAQAADAAPDRRARFVTGDFPLLRGLGTKARAAMARDLEIQRCHQGEIVIAQGEDSHALYFVLAGELLGIMLSDSGKEVAFARFGPDSCFGEFSALDAGPRSLTVSAATACCLARLPCRHFRSWLQREPVIGHNLALELIARNRDLTNRFFELIVHDVDTRVRLLLSRLAQSQSQLIDGGVLDPAPTHELMAAHVGANREAVSRAISHLTRTGVISAQRRRVRIHDAAALLPGTL